MALRGVVVDAGHGGDDPGAVGNNIIEKDLTLKAATYINDRLNSLGIPSKLVRDKDETVSPTERTKRILNAFGDNSDVVVLSNHINAGGGDGAETIYALRNSDVLAKSMLEEIGKEGQNMRKYYQRRLPSDPSKDYYFIHRNTGKTQPVIVEYGFLDSTGDDVSQLKNNLLDYAEAVVRAVAKYAGVNYVPPKGSNVYVVQKGDNLWKIANKYGVTVGELKDANNLSSDLLNIGDILVIPKKNDVVDESLYTVKKGDNLWSISRNYGVTVDELKELNNLTNNLLYIGQVLKIPKKDIDEVIHVVEKGDTLWSIAKKYNTTVNDLKKYNNLIDNLLSIGQILKIPV